MKKTILVLLVGLALFLAGCAQQTPTQNQNSNQPAANQNQNVSQPMANINQNVNANINVNQLIVNTDQNINTNQQNQTNKINFTGNGGLIKTDLIWHFTVRKYDSQNDSWSKEGPFTLKFTESSKCQSTSIKSINCANFPLLNQYENSIAIEGIKTGNEITVLKLSIIQ